MYSLYTRSSHLCILPWSTGANTDSPYHLPLNLNRQSASNQREPPAIAVVYAVARPSRYEVLRLCCVCRGRHSVAGGCERFVYGDVDGGEFSVGHAGEVEEEERGVDESNVEIWTAVSSECLLLILHYVLTNAHGFGFLLGCLRGYLRCLEREVGDGSGCHCVRGDNDGEKEER